MAKRVSGYYCGMWYTSNVPLDAREEREREREREVGGGKDLWVISPSLYFLVKRRN